MVKPGLLSLMNELKDKGKTANAESGQNLAVTGTNASIDKTELQTAQPAKVIQRRAEDSEAGKRSDPRYKQISVYVRKDIHKDVKREIVGDMDFSDLMESLLQSWLRARGIGPSASTQ